MRETDLRPEDWLVREVFAAFGFAIYESNCLEHGLATLLVTAWNETPITQSEYDRLHRELRAMTFGGLIRHARLSPGADPSLLQRLEESLEVRNRLAHRYFEEHAVAFMFPEGQEDMRDELHELSASLQALHLELSEVVRAWGEVRGIAGSDIELAARDLSDEYLALRPES